MTKHHIMRISGWLPVSYSVYMHYERLIGNDCYNIAKIVADKLNDNSKLSNKKLISILGINLDDSKILKNGNYMDHIEQLIDFIRDSFIIYQDTIKQEKQDAIAAVLA